ncbi:hypothetical protein [Pseudoalteromonas spongiae]|uniref:hypothetical protein n=1 Tax=Pseudoalteromonas spongiae TaxID=298657 RepID=UPI000C2D11AF|nr:hypothetical protein [Pseudoalteromonas spongiae]
MKLNVNKIKNKIKKHWNRQKAGRFVRLTFRWENCGQSRAVENFINMTLLLFTMAFIIGGLSYLIFSYGLSELLDHWFKIFLLSISFYGVFNGIFKFSLIPFMAVVSHTRPHMFYHVLCSIALVVIPFMAIELIDAL